MRRATGRVGGEGGTKPGQAFLPDVAVAIADPAQDYVSRAALKLAAGLDHFQLAPAGRTCLDIGSSTGGFTDVLLHAGAAHVPAVQVGTGPMKPTLPRTDKGRVGKEGVSTG